jgi:parallel beta-helix repeat protein
MEVAAIDGLTVKNCTFKDMAGNDSSGKKEALQLDVVCSSYAYKNTILDGTPMKNVIITGCTFQNVPRGVGTHSMLLGSYHTNIEITDNVFENVDGECIVALNYKNCTIRGNKMKNSGAGIIFQFFKPNVSAVYNTIQDGTVTYSGSVEHDSDSIISNNEISINTSKYASEYVGIRIYGYNLEQDTVASGNGSSDLIPKGDYYVSNVRIVGNTIKTCGNGIHLSDARDCTVIGNKITNIDENSWDDGILVDEDSKNISIQKNEVKNSTRYGIRLENYSSATSIYGNTVSASIYYGISVNNNSKVTGNIEKNTIKNCDDNGICIQEYSRVKNISNNTITSCDWHGITLYDGCEVTGNITGNKISKCGQNGIFLNLESSAKSVTKNTLTQNGKYAIALYDGSQVTNSISSNTISKNKFHAIQLNLDCTADKINSNKITNTKGKGILIEDGSTVWSSISSNTINTASQEGIYVNSSRNSLTIKGNSIKKCSRSSIVINTVSKMKITISKNSIITTKGKKPLLVIKGKVKSDIKDK